MRQRLALLLAPLVLAAAARADTVTLRSSVRIPEGGGPITLGLIADLAGPEAQKHADLVLVPDALKEAGAAGCVKIDIARVRTALDGARVNWAHVQLSGGQAVVRVPQPKQEEKAAAPAAATQRAPQCVDVTGPMTVRKAAALALVALFEADPAEMRLLFDADDEALLATPEDGRRIEAQPIASERSGRVPISVTIYDGDRIAVSRTIRADVLLARDGVVVKRAVRKGGPIDDPDVAVERLWLAPGFEGPTLSEALASTARVKLTPGAPLRADDLESPVVVHKGDMVSVHCISGSVVVKTPARAMADARLGETVECRVERSKKTFLARADAKGRVIMDLTPPADINPENDALAAAPAAAAPKREEPR